MADEGVLVEALAPIGPDDEQVDDEDGEPGAEPEPDQAARESTGQAPAPTPTAFGADRRRRSRGRAPGHRCLGAYLLAK